MRGKTLHILWATLLFVILFAVLSTRADTLPDLDTPASYAMRVR